MNKQTTHEKAKSFVVTTRTVGSLVIGSIAGAVLVQSYLLLLLLIIPLIYPILVIDKRTYLNGQEYMRDGLVQSCACFLFGWLFTYNVIRLFK